jgi:hypothetical protein
MTSGERNERLRGIVTTMERLFSPCTRLHDILDNEGCFRFEHEYDLRRLQELNLDVSTQELLSAERAFTYADLYEMSGNGDTVAWLTPHTAVARKSGSDVAGYAWDQMDDSCSFDFSADGKHMAVLARSPEHLVEMCDVVLRLLAVSVVHSLRLTDWNRLDGPLIDLPALAYLMEQCQSLKDLTLNKLNLDENHCRVLGDFSRPGLEIELSLCKITSAGASALAEVLGRNQGPTTLSVCHIDNLVLANGLRGNSRLKTLTPCLSDNVEVRNREILAIAGALRENKGLVKLILWPVYHFTMSDETWGAICDSLKTHPTLEVLDMCQMGSAFPDDAPAVLKSRIKAFVDLLKVNTSIHTIDVDALYRQHEFFRESVIPYLKTNRLRPRVRAIQKTRPIAYRAKVLGRALLAVRTDPNRFWMLLSGNAEVAFPSTTATTTPAANLRTPTTADANANTNVAPFVATASTAATSSDVTPAAGGQKRKACP